ncbi:MAG: SAM-dependent methyltransferase [Pseudomonadota bacterium]
MTAPGGGGRSGQRGGPAANDGADRGADPHEHGGTVAPRTAADPPAPAPPAPAPAPAPGLARQPAPARGRARARALGDDPTAWTTRAGNDPGAPGLPDGALARRLKARIAARGPISVAEYMTEALGDPVYGYYTTRDPLGVAGDFTTAPEISQMFGEIVGLWLADRAEAAGPTTQVVELGPGRGTLMVDARRAAPSLADRTLWLIETSTTLRVAQDRRLPGARWLDRLHAVPEAPMVLVGNEYLDVLPVRQYLADGQAWREVQIGIGAGGRLTFGLSGPLAVLAQRLGPPVPGAWAEISAVAEADIAEIARRIAAFGGAAILFDYGFVAADRPSGPTLQAVQNHRPVAPLSCPGEADLTWLPDFDLLGAHARASAAVDVHITRQGAFLAELGIGERAAALAAARPDEATAVADALERLTLAEEMGALFKVMAIVPSGAARPPGFHPLSPVPARAAAQGVR